SNSIRYLSVKLYNQGRNLTIYPCESIRRTVWTRNAGSMSRPVALELPMYIVDAFSSRPFTGNPAAVCLCVPGVKLADDVRQRIAAEMNHSETAFVEPLGETSKGMEVFSSDSAFGLRWFTPTCEVPCCGHATLASAAVLLLACDNLHPAISFHTLSGELVVSRASTAAATIHNTAKSPTTANTRLAENDALDQQPLSSPQQLALSLLLPLCEPVDPVPACAEDPAGLLVRACAGSLPVREVLYCAKRGLNYVLLVLEDSVSRRELEALRPDFAAMMRAASAEEVHGVIVCAKTGLGSMTGTCAGQISEGNGAEPEAEVCSRFFAPWMGINEDPVTGSAHAVLGSYWDSVLQRAGVWGLAGASVGQGGGIAMRMRQCSARGGEVTVEVLREEGRVRVTGMATLVLEGKMRF
ncbi:hypothetical protein VaNZ11_002854, partial [Volvox africanus]